MQRSFRLVDGPMRSQTSSPLNSAGLQRDPAIIVDLARLVSPRGQSNMYADRPGLHETRIRELVTGAPRLALIVEPLLAVRRVMRQQFAVLHKMLLDTVRHCRR